MVLTSQNNIKDLEIMDKKYVSLSKLLPSCEFVKATSLSELQEGNVTASHTKCVSAVLDVQGMFTRDAVELMGRGVTLSDNV